MLSSAFLHEKVSFRDISEKHLYFWSHQFWDEGVDQFIGIYIQMSVDTLWALCVVTCVEEGAPLSFRSCCQPVQCRSAVNTVLNCKIQILYTVGVDEELQAVQNF